MKTNLNLAKSDTEIIETLLHNGKELFSNSDLNLLLFNGKASSKQIFKLIDRLFSKNWLLRLERGKYILKNVSSGIQHNPFIIAMLLLPTSAVAYWSALNFYGLTEQIPKTIFIQTIHRRKPAEIQNSIYKFITINNNKFFGLRNEWIQHLSFQITDIEKTIVDCFDSPAYCGGIIECAKALTNLNNINSSRLIDYAVKMNNSAIIKRIGFVSELLGINVVLEQIIKRNIILSPKYSLLDTSLKDQGRYSTKWRLRINLDPQQLNQIIQ